MSAINSSPTANYSFEPQAKIKHNIEVQYIVIIYDG